MSNTHNILPNDVLSLIAKGATAFKDLNENKNYTHKVISNIDCSTLPTPEWKKGKPAPEELKYIWEKLPDNSLPCLYFFEILSPDTTTILTSFRKFKATEELKHRASPALKKNPPLNTNVLYAGKVKDDIVGRMVVHFAYYHVGATAGLQLASWAKEISLRLNLHIYSFDIDMHEFVSSLELTFAHSIKPLIGKH